MSTTAADLAHFGSWCDAHGHRRVPASPETVALYVTDLSSVAKVSTINRRLAAISRAHRECSLESPTTSQVVRRVVRGIRREKGTAPDRKAPVTGPELRAMLAGLGTGLAAARDRAILLLGFHGAFRRSELVALDVADLIRVREGLRVNVRRSKTDQEGAGMIKAIVPMPDVEVCAVSAVQEWLRASGVTDGPVFRAVDRHGRMSERRLSDRAVADLIKRVAARSGLDPARFSGHSLRAGLVTQAALDGVPERVIQGMSGHKSIAVLRGYVRNANVFAESVGKFLKLSIL